MVSLWKKIYPICAYYYDWKERNILRQKENTSGICPDPEQLYDHAFCGNTRFKSLGRAL